MDGMQLWHVQSIIRARAFPVFDFDLEENFSKTTYLKFLANVWGLFVLTLPCSSLGLASSRRQGTYKSYPLERDTNRLLPRRLKQGVVLQGRNCEGGEYLIGILLVDLLDILNRIWLPCVSLSLYFLWGWGFCWHQSKAKHRQRMSAIRSPCDETNVEVTSCNDNVF